MTSSARTNALDENPVHGAHTRGLRERTVVLVHRPDAGAFVLDGQPVRGWRHRAPGAQRTAVGVVFQQPRLSADPRLSLRELIAQPLRATGRRSQVADRLTELAPAVGLTAELLNRRPHEVSDGQLQRACLARALVLRPRWLICDEMTAMLDASTTAALVAAVEDHRRESGAGLLAVGHDRVLLERWCDRTVTWQGITGPVASQESTSPTSGACAPRKSDHRDAGASRVRRIQVDGT